MSSDSKDNSTEDGKVSEAIANSLTHLEGGWNDVISKKTDSNSLQFLGNKENVKEMSPLYLNNFVVNTDGEIYSKCKNLTDYAMATYKDRSDDLNIIFGLNSKEIELLGKEIGSRVECLGPSVDGFCLKRSLSLFDYVLIKNKEKAEQTEQDTENKENNNNLVITTGKAPIFFTLSKHNDITNVIKYKDFPYQSVQDLKVVPTMVASDLDIKKQTEYFQHVAGYGPSAGKLLSSPLMVGAVIPAGVRFVYKVIGIFAGFRSYVTIKKGFNDALNEPGFYMLGVRNGNDWYILYIGETKNVHQRFLEHANGIHNHTTSHIYKEWFQNFDVTPDLLKQMEAGNFIGVYISTISKSAAFVMESVLLKSGKLNTLFNSVGLTIPFQKFTAVNQYAVQWADCKSFLESLQDVDSIIGDAELQAEQAITQMASLAV